jgi:hypothetical protein
MANRQELQSQAQPNQGGAAPDPAMMQAQGAPMPDNQGEPAGMPMDQGAAPMPGGQPGMMPPQPPAPTLEEQNGQGTPLIDEVTGSGIDPNTNQPISNENPMQSARNAFAQAFNNAQNPTPPMPQQQNVPPQTVPPMGMPSQPPAPQPPMGMQPPGQMGMSQPGMGNTPMPDMNTIQSLAENAVNQAVANGQLPDLTANDIAANANYGMPNIVDSGGTPPNPMEGVDGTLPTTPEGNEIDTVMTNGIPDINSDEFFESFTDNPGQAILDIANAMAAQKVGELTQQIQPLIDESNKVQFRNRVQDAIRSFSENGHQDFSQYKQGMVDFLNGSDLPMDDPVSYERAYDKAKISALEKMNQELTKTQGRTLADYMSDDDSIDQISQNEKIRGKIINDYLNGLSNGETPRVITESSGNSPVATEPKRAGSMKEAGKMFLERLKEG